SNLLSNVTVLGSMAGFVSTSGRLNVDKAIRACTPPPPPSKPSAPTGVSAKAGNTQVTLSWTAPTNATSHTLRRGTEPGTYSVVATGVTTTSYVSTGLSNGTLYYFVVSAVNSLGESSYSSVVSTTPVAPPSAPASFKVLPVVSGQLALSWAASSGATS